MSSIACLFVFLRYMPLEVSNSHDAPGLFVLVLCLQFLRFHLSSSLLDLSPRFAVSLSLLILPLARPMFVSVMLQMLMCSDPRVPEFSTFCKSSVFVSCHRHGFKWLRQRQLSFAVSLRPCHISTHIVLLVLAALVALSLWGVGQGGTMDECSVGSRQQPPLPPAKWKF